MPIFFQQDIDADTRLGIWQISEPESFFNVPLQRSITHPHKRLQHLAGRNLLKTLYPDFPLELIQVADTNRPFLEDEAFHFSISHSDDFAAVVVSRKRRVGVDIETISSKIERIAKKFISPYEEELIFTNNPISNTEMLTLIWSAKEAVFKWYGLGGVDFREHIKLRSISENENANTWETVIQFRKKAEILLNVQSKFFNGVCLSWIAT